jgi:hypothetical protein
LPAADAYSDRQVLPDAAVDAVVDAVVDAAVDAPVDVAVDAPVDAKVPDSAPDGLAPGASITKPMDYPENDVTLGDATVSAKFSVPRGAFAQQTNVTLSLVSLTPTNDDAGLAAGPIGPVFSLSKTDELGRDATLQNPGTLALTFSPTDSSVPVQRVKLAYFNTQSDPNLWIAVLTSSYDPATRILTGDVFEFPGTRLFAPVESCTTGQTCPDPETCGAEACQ